MAGRRLTRRVPDGNEPQAVTPGAAALRRSRGRIATAVGVSVGLLAVAVATWGAYRFLRGAAHAGPVRHVIVISFDTTRADQFGCYGNQTVRTPNIDKLAAESILLTDFMTAVPTTLCSHTTTFTGKYPHHHGVPRNGHMVHDDNVMLAEALKQAGFTTAGFIGSMALESLFHFNQGFDHWDETFEMMEGVDRDADQNQRRAASVTDAVIKHLDQAGTPERLFLFVHYFDPHAPYDAPPPYQTMYNPTADTRWPNYPAIRRLCRRRPGENEFARDLIGRYDGEISYLDEHVGRLIENLRRRGVLDDSILVITSDHGENFWEHPHFFEHGVNVHQTNVRAFGLIRLPAGRHGGTRIDDLVGNIDVMPTLLSYLGLPPPAGMDGAALDLENAKVPFAGRPMFAEATKPHQVELDPRWFNILKARCIRKGRYKFIQSPWLTHPDAPRDDRGLFPDREELYDVPADPLELRNLLRSPTPEITAVADELRGELEKWANSAAPLPSEYEPTQHERVQQQLAALGYAETDLEQTFSDRETSREDPFYYKEGTRPEGRRRP